MFRKILVPVCSFWILSLIALFVYAKEDVNKPNRVTVSRRAAGCTTPNAFVELNINNVRCRINSGGDMHWGLGTSGPLYEVPKVPPSDPNKIHSVFASAIWIGGYEGSNLKLAGQTYRQSGGTDYYTGPLDTTIVDITKDNCSKWDKLFSVTKDTIDYFLNAWNNGQIQSGVVAVPPPILEWPAHGSGYFGTGNESAYLAPFFDIDGDGFYDPQNYGDYPALNCDGNLSVPDQMIFWVMNDVGGTHFETNASPIGIEIRATAFAFQSNNEINDMTFYQSKIVNRASGNLDNTYFSQWVDADLGCFQDDYVGCDTTRGLGFCYNGDNSDLNCGSLGYGTSIPIVGVDFFRGPKDEFGTPIPMTKFLYYENITDPKWGNPNIAIDYYNYMSGFWLDGARWVDDYNQCSDGEAQGYNTSCTVYTNFIFPGNPYTGQGWTEGNAMPGGRPPYDRRFLQSAGPFKLLPGATNEVVTGYVWARVSSSGATAAFPTLWDADDRAQGLYDNCFAKPASPDAPDITIIEMERKLVITWEGSKTGNNYRDSYTERIPSLFLNSDPDPYYLMEGYRVYQLIDATVSASELTDDAKSKLIAQCDIKNGINTYTETVNVPGVGKILVTRSAADAGIFHSLEVTTDAFALGNNLLINNRPYYFMVVAYGYNDGICEVCTPIDTVLADDEKFITSEKNILNVAGIPHKVDPEEGGTTIHSKWGDNMNIVRIDGVGNRGNSLEITEDAENTVLSSYFLDNLPYKGSSAPLDLKIVNPKKVKGEDYRLEVSAPDSTGKYYEWKLYDITSGKQLILTAGDVIKTTQTDTVMDEKAFKALDYIVPDRGFSVALNTVANPGDMSIRSSGNGFISATINYDDVTKAWLDGVPDIDGYSGGLDWILSGSANGAGTDSSDASYPGFSYLDPTSVYEGILRSTNIPFGNGTFTAYRFAAQGKVVGGNLRVGTRPNPMDTVATAYENANFGKLPNVDIVFTDDQSKWSKCVVVQTYPDPFPTANDIFGGLRNQAGVDKDGSAMGTGLGWFPGYAINLDTGERLNIFYGEAPLFSTSGNGADMLWNPEVMDPLAGFFPELGGMHYVYVHNSRYDKCDSIATKLVQPVSAANLQDVYKDVAWTGNPMLAPGYGVNNGERFIPSTTTRIKLRVTKSYAEYPVGFRPVYEFSTKGLAAELNQNEVAKNALDLIRIVPNPYYAYAAYYEGSPLESRVKITNLPQKATIKIFTLSGTLVKTVDKDDNLTYVFWNLQNTKNIPVASGVYIIHIDAPGIGEKIIKFFGVMRPLDIDSY